MKTKIVYQNSFKDAIASGVKKVLCNISISLLKRYSTHNNTWVLLSDPISRDMLSKSWYEHEFLQAIIAIIPDMNSIVLDVGANIGNHTIFLAHHFTEVISFEPVPENAAILRNNVFIHKLEKKVTIVEKGLSSTHAKLAIDDSDRENTNCGLISEKAITSDKRLIEVARGDDIIESLRVKRKISCIKIDVEGMEPDVIKGLSKVIKKDKPFIFWEAFNKDTVGISKKILESYGYDHFYHISKSSSPKKHKKNRIFVTAYLHDLEQSSYFGGMNLASPVFL